MHADEVFVCHHADIAALLDRHDTTSKGGIVETAGMTAESGKIAAITENGVAIGIVETAGKRSRPASKAGLIFCPNEKTVFGLTLHSPGGPWQGRSST